MPTKIFVMTHKKFNCPDDPAYIPLHVGRAVSNDLGYMGDDTGDSISSMNCYYGELTGLYWIWKNYCPEHYDENMGLCHYRRYFVNDSRTIMKESEFDDILKDYDIITSKAVISGDDGKTYEETYGESHDISDLILTGKTIRKLYPEDYPVFLETIKGNRTYFGNLMVAGGKIFDSYCTWLFSVFNEMKKSMDLSMYGDEYNRRVFGFLSEHLLYVWVRARKLRVYEGRVVISDEKAEVKELKASVGYLLKKGCFDEASNLFYEVLKVRPDVTLEQSDLRGDIPLLEQIIYICSEEHKAGTEGILSVCRNIDDMLCHVRHVTDILRKENWTDDDRKYLNEMNVSDIAAMVLALNNNTAYRAEELPGLLHSNTRKC